MFAVLRRNPVALVLAVLLHIGLAIFLILEVDWRDEVKPIGADVKVVQARLVDAPEPLPKVDEQKAADRVKAEAERKKQAALERRRAEDKRKLAEIEAQRKQRQQAEKRAAEKKAAERKAAEKKAAEKRAAEMKRVEAEKVRLAEAKRKEAEQKKKEDAEMAHRAELKAQHEAEEKQRQLEQAERKKAEEAAKAEAAAAKAQADKERKARQASEKAEVERKRKAAAEAKARAAREAELAAQFEAEQDASEKARVVGQIRAKVERRWLRPPGTGVQGLRCTVRVRLGGSGSVLLVNVVKSSGNTAFDRSVEAAVRKADPLPMPRSQRLLAQFREIEFVFEPSN